MRRLFRALLALTATLVAASPLAAARIAVVPVRIELAHTSRFCSLQVSNQGTEQVALQVRGFAWSQGPDGSEELGPADIRLNPSIFELAPGERKLVRCSLPAPGGPNESAFRLLVDELPRGRPEPGTMQTLLRLSLPIFRTPAGARPQLRWSAGKGGALELVNLGRTHAAVSGLTVSRAGRPAERLDRGFYLLAGARRTIAQGDDAAPVTGVEAVTGSGKTDAVAKLAD